MSCYIDEQVMSNTEFSFKFKERVQKDKYYLYCVFIKTANGANG